jgi:hypothetical protein
MEKLSSGMNYLIILGLIVIFAVYIIFLAYPNNFYKDNYLSTVFIIISLIGTIVYFLLYLYYLNISEDPIKLNEEVKSEFSKTPTPDQRTIMYNIVQNKITNAVIGIGIFFILFLILLSYQLGIKMSNKK